MKLGLHLGYSSAELRIPVALVQRAEALGYDSVWTAEAYGSDAVTPLAYLAGKTERIKLGTAVMQIAARTPANAAMSAATIDALAGGGRFLAGLGVSGPQIVEGWYGQPWGSPYWRTRDYVAIMRKIFRREAPVNHQGREISLPYDGPGALGVGKPLKSILHMNPEVALYLGGMGHRDKNSHKDIMVRRGHREAAERIQELYLAGRKDEAAATVPDEWVDQKSLVGPPARIKERYRAWADCGLTGLTIRCKQPQAVEVIAKAARAA